MMYTVKRIDEDLNSTTSVTVVLQQKDVFHVWQDVPDDRTVQVQDHT